MKFLICLFAVAAIALAASDDKPDKKEGLVGSTYGAPSYGGHAPSYAPPPCPKNYLFSCQPNLAPVPCAPGGYSGAYSEHIPQYALPQQYGFPQYPAMPQYSGMPQ